MSFGKRAASPVGAGSPAAPRRRRGGYWLALLATGAASVAVPSAMAFVPFFNPTGQGGVGIILEAAITALTAVVPVSAVVFLLVDLLLKALRRREAWLYAGLCGGPLFAIFFWISNSGERSTGPLFVATMILLPALLGGWVLGRFRAA
jgi:hypothetical protein